MELIEIYGLNGIDRILNCPIILFASDRFSNFKNHFRSNSIDFQETKCNFVQIRSNFISKRPAKHISIVTTDTVNHNMTTIIILPNSN